jgi:hypothetical protein
MSTSPGRERAAPEPASVGVHVVDGQPLWWCDEPDCELTAGHEEEHQDETGRRWLTGERAVAPAALHDYHRPGGWEVAALADVDALLAELAGVDTRPYTESERLDLLRELAYAERLRARVSELAEERALVDQARRAAEEDVADFRELLAVAEKRIRDAMRVLDLVDEDGSELDLPARLALLVGELRARREASRG